MQANSEYVPSSCNWDLSLQAPKEVRRCEDFIMLDMQKEAALQECKLKMASFAKASYTLACTHFREQHISQFSLLLAKAAGGFIAQLNIKNWNKHTAIMDLLALHADNVLSPFNASLLDFLH